MRGSKQLSAYNARLSLAPKGKRAGVNFDPSTSTTEGSSADPGRFDTSTDSDSLDYLDDGDENETGENVRQEGLEILAELELYMGYNFYDYLTGRKYLEHVFNLWHTIVTLVSLFMMGLGIAFHRFLGYVLTAYVQVYIKQFDNYKPFLSMAPAGSNIHFTGFVQALGWDLMVANSVYVISAIGYMCYSWHRSRFTLPVLCLACSFAGILEVSMAHIRFSPKLIQDESLVNTLRAKLQTNYTIQGSDEFSLAYNYVSIWLGCCGISDRLDFQQARLTLPRTLSKGRTVQVAPTCCQRDVFMISGNKGRQKVVECATTAKATYEEGCFTKLTEALQTFCHFYEAIVIFHLIDCFMHAWVYKNRVTVLDRALRARYGPELDELKII